MPAIRAIAAKIPASLVKYLASGLPTPGLPTPGLPRWLAICRLRYLALWLAFVAAACTPQEGEEEAEVLPQSGQTAHAERLYAAHCASCHDGGLAGAPTRASLQEMTVKRISDALTDGVMKQQGAALNRFDKIVLAQMLGRETPVISDIGPKCTGRLVLGKTLWGSWGGNAGNHRFQNAENAGIAAGEIAGLELAWAFGFPGAQRARSQPAVTENALFTGSQAGLVYALKPDTGCVWWAFQAQAEVRNAPLIGQKVNSARQAIYFGDVKANVYAVDGETGEEIWSKSLRDHPDGTITGSIVQHGNILFVPLSSLEVLSAYSDDYECCTFRGGVAALNATTGETLWRWYSTAPPQKRGQNAKGVAQWGPSGAPVWSTPTIDAQRGLIYVGTGENYSQPTGKFSDAIVAIEMKTGKLRWARQTIKGDAWNAACSERGQSGANCPKARGPDFDFGAAPILIRHKTGRDILLAGQKSGMVYALDPDDGGAIIWQARAGMGGFNGGIHWGMASDGEALYVGIADTPGSIFAEGPPRPGIHAFDVANGQRKFSRIEPPTCSDASYACTTALSAPLTAMPGAIFAGAHNGRFIAYSPHDGSILWMDETNRKFSTVNGIDAKGGTIDGAGAVVAGGMVFVNSGYDKFGEIGGNVLLAYRPRGKTE